MKLELVASISDRDTAIQRSGKLEGGGRVTFDVSEKWMGALATMMPLVLIPLRITVEPDLELLEDQSFAKQRAKLGERAELEAKAKEAPEWASRSN